MKAIAVLLIFAIAFQTLALATQDDAEVWKNCFNNNCKKQLARCTGDNSCNRQLGLCQTQAGQSVTFSSQQRVYTKCADQNALLKDVVECTQHCWELTK